MKKFKIVTFVVVIVSCLFLFTGCKKENKNSIFELNQVDKKNITGELENVEYKENLSGTVEVADGEAIIIDYKLEDLDTVRVQFYQIDEEGNKKDFGYSDLNGEGNNKTEDIEAGKYELEFVVESKTATGNFKAYAG